MPRRRSGSDEIEGERRPGATPLEQVAPPLDVEPGVGVMKVSRATWAEMLAEPAWKEEMITSGRVVLTD